MRHAATVLFAVLGSFFACASADAQVIFIHFKNEKLAKNYDEYLSSYQNEPAIICEPKEGFTLTDEKLTYSGGPEAKNVVWVTDPAKPQNVPYEMKGAAKVTAKGGKIISIPGDSIARIGYVDKLLTLEGVAIEYRLRTDSLKELRAARDASKKGERDWFAGHGRVVQKLDGLVSWLNQMGYGPAAKKHKSELERERKTVAKEASAAREKAALASVTKVETPEHLNDVAKDIVGPKEKYHVRESLHGRIVYPLSLVTDAQAEHALELMEQLIEGFRKQFVDPYLDEDYPDYIPDTVFGEFFYMQSDVVAYERFYGEYYGLHFATDRKEERLKMGATGGRVGRAFLHYAKYGEQHDLDGDITHVTGHWLAELHYGNGNLGSNHDWLREALGYYLSFEYIGRNSLTCFNWAKAEYAKPPEQEGKKTVQLGQKGGFNELALATGPALDQLFIRELSQFTDADLAKAWSFYDYIAKKTKREGQMFLRILCFAAIRGKSGFLERERAQLETLMGIEGKRDVYGVLDERWKAFARTDQMK